MTESKQPYEAEPAPAPETQLLAKALAQVMFLRGVLATEGHTVWLTSDLGHDPQRCLGCIALRETKDG